MRKVRTKIIFVFLLIILSSGNPSYGKEVPFTLEDRERLIRLEAKVIEMEKRIEQRFEQIDKR